MISGHLASGSSGEGDGSGGCGGGGGSGGCGGGGDGSGGGVVEAVMMVV